MAFNKFRKRGGSSRFSKYKKEKSNWNKVAGVFLNDGENGPSLTIAFLDDGPRYPIFISKFGAGPLFAKALNRLIENTDPDDLSSPIANAMQKVDEEEGEYFSKKAKKATKAFIKAVAKKSRTEPELDEDEEEEEEEETEEEDDEESDEEED